MQPDDAMAGNLGVGDTRQTLGARPVPGMECPKNRARSGPGALAQILKYSAHFIGTLNQLNHHSLEHSAWPRDPDGLTQVFRQVFTSPLVAVDDPGLFYIACDCSSGGCLNGNLEHRYFFLFLVHDHPFVGYTWH